MRRAPKEMTNSTSKHKRAPRNIAFFLISLLMAVIWSSAGHAREIREIRLHPLEITLAPGASMNLQVFALFDDETEEELTEGVVFEVKDHKVARIDGFVLTATGGGDTRIEA